MSGLGNRGAVFDALTTICFIAGALSCRQIAGIPDNPPTDATTAYGLQYGTTGCAQCANEHCQGESAACAVDEDCNNDESCLGGCNGSAACRSNCTIKNAVPTESAALVSALSACLARHCDGKSECKLTCGGFAGYLSEPDASAECELCLQQINDCSHASTCGQSPACDEFWRCWLACVTPDCHSSCEQQYAEGAALFHDLYSDFQNCAGRCGYGSYWACAGQKPLTGRPLMWPPAKSRVVSVSNFVYDWQSRAGVPDAMVQICPTCPCQNDVPQGRTSDGHDGGDAGYYTLQFDQLALPTGMNSPFCTQVSAPGYQTVFAYWGYAPVEPVVTGLSSLLAPTVWGIALETPDAQAALNRSLGTGYYETQALFVSAIVHDCLGSPAAAGAANVAINVSDPMMLAHKAIDAGADGPTVPTGNAGDVDVYGSVALFLNVPAGARPTLTLAVPGVGVVSQFQVDVAPNTATEIGMQPTPPPSP